MNIRENYIKENILLRYNVAFKGRRKTEEILCERTKY